MTQCPVLVSKLFHKSHQSIHWSCIMEICRVTDRDTMDTVY